MQTAAPPDAQKKRPKVYTIPAGRPFLKDLAAGIADMAGTRTDPAALADARILLPTRRAARALAEAFVETSGAKAILAPRIDTLADVDGEAMALEAAPAAYDDIAAPPPADPLRRRFLLARLIAARDETLSGAGAFALADDLARLLDSIYTENVDISKFRAIVPDAYAEHWAQSVEFLTIVTDMWPAILAEDGRADPAKRQRDLITARADLWAAAPPQGLVVAAGSTGSAPATRRLLKAVACAPRGAVVLPGLDLALDAAAWEQIDDPHPQKGLKRLLKNLGVEREDVRLWPGTPEAADTKAPRPMLISAALRPAEATDDWRDIVARLSEDEALLDASLEGLSLVTAKDEREEAGAVALMMREALETPGRTAMLVTPDRNLARRVSAALARWGVAVDDSAGRPLSGTEVGAFLRLIARLAVDPSDPVLLMSVLKHPLAALGRPRAALLAEARTFERRVLRKPRPGPGAQGWRQALNQAGEDQPALHKLLDDLDAALAPLSSLAASGETRLAALAEAHAAAAEAFAATDETTGANRLWVYEDGEAAADLLARTAAEGKSAPATSGAAYPALFDQLSETVSIRPRGGVHPRLSILGPLEARLQQADLVILGGLNEGAWPTEARLDPFLSRPMRAALGLPSLERKIGLAAHDFSEHAAAPAVALVRAAKSGGAPTTPSRWLLRLTNILDKLGRLQGVDRSTELSAWLAALDAAPSYAPCTPPRPAPPVAARPRVLSVTDIETLARDPYAIYARRILGLRRLDPLNADFEARLRGTMLHDIFETFSTNYKSTLPADARDQLDRLAHGALHALGLDAADIAFWRPRLAASLDWFAAFEDDARAEGAPALLEDSGAFEIDAPAGAFRITARADRIDRLNAGGYAVYDYKLGAPPTKDMVAAGFSPQLTLEALIAEAGGVRGTARGLCGKAQLPPYRRTRKRHRGPRRGAPDAGARPPGRRRPHRIL
ncbi:MAG: double-strand break repair protein AddB [Pseudomonadota bacterium]